jgi:hypothetical protein
LLAPLVTDERFDLLKNNNRHLYKSYDRIEPHMDTIKAEVTHIRELKQRIESQISLGKYLLVGRTPLTVLMEMD